MWKSLCSCSPCKHSGNKHSVLATIFHMNVSVGREVCSWILILLFDFSRPFLPRPSGHPDLILSLEWFRNPNRSHAYLHLPGCSRPGSPQVPAAITVPGSAALQCQSWISICPRGLSGLVAAELSVHVFIIFYSGFQSLCQERALLCSCLKGCVIS